MTIDFYHLLVSAPCRSVLMAAKAVGVELNLIALDIMGGDQLKPEFIKINPQHIVPTLVDNGFALWESRAILVYLAEKYDKNGSLYPKCPKARAIINQRLYFDMGVLYQRFVDYYHAPIFDKEPGDPEKLKKMLEGVEFFEKFLENTKYAAGNEITIADLSMAATISTYEVVGFDLSKYPNIEKWYEKCKLTLPGWNLNEEGLKQFKAFLNK